MGKKFDIMRVAVHVGGGTIGGAAAGLAADKLLPQLNDGMKGLAMLALGAASTAAGTYWKQEMLVGAGAGMAGAAGDRMQRYYIGGGAAPDAPAAGIGNPDYTVVVDSEVQDYPTSGNDDPGGVAGNDDPGGMA